MKFLNSIYDLLLEGIDSYNFELIEDKGNNTKYSFQDLNGNNYLVQFIPVSGDSEMNMSTTWELSWFVMHDGDYTVSKVVNVNPYKTIKTVLGDIINDFIKRKSWVKVITMEGLSKEQEKDYISQRTKMYVRFLERNPIPGYKMRKYGNRINLIKI